MPDTVTPDCEATIDGVVRRAREEGRQTLREAEAYCLAEALGLSVPRHVVVEDVEEVTPELLARLGSGRCVVKVHSHRILHKSARGGVRFTDGSVAEIRAAVSAMTHQFPPEQREGFLLVEALTPGLGFQVELLLGMRFTSDFGPVVTVGLGGVHAELLAGGETSRGNVVLFVPGTTAADIERTLHQKRFLKVLSRRQQQLLVDRIRAALDLAVAVMPDAIAEFEVNPLVFQGERLVALDSLARLAQPGKEPMPARPRLRLAGLLEPRSIAIVGVSERPNPGHIILQNTLRAGFDQRHVFLIKPGREECLGCRCVPDLASLPEPVDLLIVSIEAAKVPPLVEEAVRTGKARSLVVIPGGLGERSGTETLVDRIQQTLRDARGRADPGPVVNGGNCLGIRSIPGRYDTLFIPGHKLRFPDTKPAPLALISQSGAFAVARASRLEMLNPRYLITAGNQVDLTIGDYLEFLAGDPDVEVFACYVEGFQPGDGQRFLAAARRIVAAGRTVILYRAGRTQAGADASASHTASIAGDYTVTRELAAAAGVLVADSLADFDDLIRLGVALRQRTVGGWNLGALSNAGFECVALADQLGQFRCPPFRVRTAERLEALFERARLDRILEVHNPVDLTPIMNDELFEAAARAVLEDPGIDVGVIGCVPLTGALATLAPDPDHAEDVTAPDSVAQRLVRLRESTEKAWIAVVDGGPLFDPMASLLERHGIPTFQTADRALRLLGRYCASRLARSRSSWLGR